jgi:hypothetical protein
LTTQEDMFIQYGQYVMKGALLNKMTGSKKQN